MFSQEHEFTAVHEAGHALCVERQPPARPVSTTPTLYFPESLITRTLEIGLEYDDEYKRFDGWIGSVQCGLSDEERLFIALGGRVAELMARTEGNWDITAIQLSILRGEFGDTQDMKDVSTLLSKISEKNQRERLLTETVFSIFSFLKENWNLLTQVADALLSTFDTKTRKAVITYAQLSRETQAQLNKLKRAFPTGF